MVRNADIAEKFRKIAELLGLKGENLFRIRAYEKTAQTIEHCSLGLYEILQEKGLRGLEDIPGIGQDLAVKIEEILDTGTCALLTQLEKVIPEGLLEIMKVEGMGPKKTNFVWKRFGVESIKDLKQVLAQGKLTKIKGWGEKSVSNILRGIELYLGYKEYMPGSRARVIADEIVAYLKGSETCNRIEIAGSLRRMKDSVKDIDILASSKFPDRAMDAFTRMPFVKEVIARGEKKSTVILSSGIEADIRVVEDDAFGAALYYFTGSKDHNVHTRRLAIEKGLTISEYGVYEGTPEKRGKLLASTREGDVFRVLGLPFIPPELREDRGEIELGIAGTLPSLVEEKDIRGDLHTHTSFSDARSSMEDMARKAFELGHEYIAITDHGSAMGMVRGVKKDNVDEYLEMIKHARNNVQGIHILSGSEVDILEDGSLYLPDDVLSRLDWVVASLHSGFRQEREKITARYLRVLENPYVRALGHPSARMLGERAPVECDWHKVFEKAKEKQVALEINAALSRLDLDDILARQAKDVGVKFVIDSDAHDVDQLEYRNGVAQARRGWVEKKDVLNALPWDEFQKILHGR